MPFHGVLRTLALQFMTAKIGLAAEPDCKYIPGDASWPQPQHWSRLNQTVNGRLIATVPIGSVCHYPNYDETRCNQLTTNWGLANTQ